MRSLTLLMLTSCVALAAPITVKQQPKLARLTFDARLDVPVGLLIGTTGASLVALRPWLATSPCRASCTPEQVNALDASARALRWNDVRAARTTGDIVGYGLMPAFVATSGLVGLAEGESLGEVAEDTWIIAESFAASHVLESTIKYTTARARPDTTFGSPVPRVDDASDLYTSMVSGHATASFAIAVSTGVVATLRGRRSAPYLWASGLSLAVVSSWLRIAADRHYLTDVLAGAALGSLMGVVVPLVFHGVSAPVTIAPHVSSNGGGLTLSGVL